VTVQDLALLLALGTAFGVPFATWLVATQRSRHEKELAAIDRVQRRRESAYVDLLAYVFRIRDYVVRTRPIFKASGDPDAPTFPAEDELRGLEARIAAHGSRAVVAALTEANDKAHDFSNAVWMLDALDKGAGTGAGMAQAWKDVEAARKAYVQSIDPFVVLISSELADTGLRPAFWARGWRHLRGAKRPSWLRLP
jgi:hypothetical protein